MGPSRAVWANVLLSMIHKHGWMNACQKIRGGTAIRRAAVVASLIHFRDQGGDDILVNTTKMCSVNPTGMCTIWTKVWPLSGVILQESRVTEVYRFGRKTI